MTPPAVLAAGSATPHCGRSHSDCRISCRLGVRKRMGDKQPTGDSRDGSLDPWPAVQKVVFPSPLQPSQISHDATRTSCPAIFDSQIVLESYPQPCAPPPPPPLPPAHNTHTHTHTHTHPCSDCSLPMATPHLQHL